MYGMSRSKPKFTDDTFVWLQCDLAKPEQITKSLETISEPTLDLLVSNAGVYQAEMASEVTQASYAHTFSVNVLAPMLLVSGLRSKIQQAMIITVSSVGDRIPEADCALYASSKAANTIYFDCLAAELQAAKVYSLLPDYVDTPMQHQSNDSNPDFDWSATITMPEVAAFTMDVVNGVHQLESGSNIIIVTEKLKEDLESVEKLYGFNTNTQELTRL